MKERKKGRKETGFKGPTKKNNRNFQKDTLKLFEVSVVRASTQ